MACTVEGLESLLLECLRRIALHGGGCSVFISLLHGNASRIQSHSQVKHLKDEFHEKVF